MSMIVLCPTRGRPVSVLLDVLKSFEDTKTLLTTNIVFVFDNDVVDKAQYRVPELFARRFTVVKETGNMRAATNYAAAFFVDKTDILGFIGDDHRFRSKGWDAAIEEALKDGGIAYGDDLVQGEALPTQWFVTSDIVRSLGWFALPECNHFYLDNAWLDLANAARCRHYLPEVKIEHMHFSYGKSEMDETYEHTMKVGSGDAAKFNYWRMGDGFQIDAWKVIGAMQERQKSK